MKWIGCPTNFGRATTIREIKGLAYRAQPTLFSVVMTRQGTVHIWIDTTGLHTDRKVRATIGDTMNILCCESM